MMDHIIHWVRVDPSELGRTKLPGDEPMNSMAVPMMLLSLVQQLTEERDQDLVEKYRETGHWCVQKILQHIQVRLLRLTTLSCLRQCVYMTLKQIEFLA